MNLGILGQGGIKCHADGVHRARFPHSQIAHVARDHPTVIRAAEARAFKYRLGGEGIAHLHVDSLRGSVVGHCQFVDQPTPHKYLVGRGFVCLQVRLRPNGCFRCSCVVLGAGIQHIRVNPRLVGQRRVIAETIVHSHDDNDVALAVHRHIPKITGHRSPALLTRVHTDEAIGIRGDEGNSSGKVIGHLHPRSPRWPQVGHRERVSKLGASNHRVRRHALGQRKVRGRLHGCDDVIFVGRGGCFVRVAGHLRAVHESGSSGSVGGNSDRHRHRGVTIKGQRAERTCGLVLTGIRGARSLCRGHGEQGYLCGQGVCENHPRSVIGPRVRHGDVVRDRFARKGSGRRGLENFQIRGRGYSGRGRSRVVLLLPVGGNGGHNGLVEEGLSCILGRHLHRKVNVSLFAILQVPKCAGDARLRAVIGTGALG